MFYESLRYDLESFIRSSQATVTGEVVVETSGGVCDPVEIRTENALVRAGATYAQHADWTAAEAEGFIKIHGQSAALGAAVRQKVGINQEVDACSAVS